MNEPKQNKPTMISSNKQDLSTLTDKQKTKIQQLMKGFNVKIEECTAILNPFYLGTGWVELQIPRPNARFDYVIGIDPDGIGSS